MAIYLGRLLPSGSIELPNLLFHQRGFATLPCRHGASDEAVADTITLFTFDPEGFVWSLWYFP